VQSRYFAAKDVLGMGCRCIVQVKEFTATTATATTTTTTTTTSTTTTTTTTVVKGAAPSYIPEGLHTIKKIAQVLQMGLQAVRDGLKPFRRAPPDVRAGMDIFDKQLWAVVEFVSSEDDLASEKMASIKEAWDKLFANNADIYDDIYLFQSTGDTDALTRAVVTIVKLPLSLSSTAFPDLSYYFDAIVDMIEGLGKTWHLFFEGKSAEGIEALWRATKKAVDKIVPEEWREDSIYQNVTGVIDGVTSELSKTVLEYKRLVLESQVCYKNTITRGRTRPQVCRDGFMWDGGHLCIPHPENAADCWGPCGKKAGNCSDFCGADRVCCRRNYRSDPAECEGAVGYIDYLFTKGSSVDYHQCVYPASKLKRSSQTPIKLKLRGQMYGSYEAVCDTSSKWNEKHGGWCATRCPDGFYAKSSSECGQICGGKFPADGWGVCGVNPGEPNKALFEMAKTVLWGALKAAPLILNMTASGFAVSKFVETIKTLIEMGKPFARPMCPMPTGFRPEPLARNPVVFTVADAGDPRLNGEWMKVGSHRQRPTYTHIGNEDAVVEWSQSRMAWRMFIDDTWFGHGRTTLYTSTRNTLTVPMSGWIVADGAFPAPIIVMATSQISS